MSWANQFIGKRSNLVENYHRLSFQLTVSDLYHTRYPIPELVALTFPRGPRGEVCPVPLDYYQQLPSKEGIDAIIQILHDLIPLYCLHITIDISEDDILIPIVDTTNNNTTNFSSNNISNNATNNPARNAHINNKPTMQQYEAHTFIPKTTSSSSASSSQHSVASNYNFNNSNINTSNSSSSNNQSKRVVNMTRLHEIQAMLTKLSAMLELYSSRVQHTNGDRSQPGGSSSVENHLSSSVVNEHNNDVVGTDGTGGVSGGMSSWSSLSKPMLKSHASHIHHNPFNTAANAATNAAANTATNTTAAVHQDTDEHVPFHPRNVTKDLSPQLLPSPHPAMPSLGYFLTLQLPLQHASLLLHTFLPHMEIQGLMISLPPFESHRTIRTLIALQQEIETHFYFLGNNHENHFHYFTHKTPTQNTAAEATDSTFTTALPTTTAAEEEAEEEGDTNAGVDKPVVSHRRRHRKDQQQAAQHIPPNGAMTELTQAYLTATQSVASSTSAKTSTTHSNIDRNLLHRIHEEDDGTTATATTSNINTDLLSLQDVPPTRIPSTHKDTPLLLFGVSYFPLHDLLDMFLERDIVHLKQCDVVLQTLRQHPSLAAGHTAGQHNTEHHRNTTGNVGVKSLIPNLHLNTIELLHRHGIHAWIQVHEVDFEQMESIALYHELGDKYGLPSCVVPLQALHQHGALLMLPFRTFLSWSASHMYQVCRLMHPFVDRRNFVSAFKPLTLHLEVDALEAIVELSNAVDDCDDLLRIEEYLQMPKKMVLDFHYVGNKMDKGVFLWQEKVEEDDLSTTGRQVPSPHVSAFPSLLDQFTNHSMGDADEQPPQQQQQQQQQDVDDNDSWVSSLQASPVHAQPQPDVPINRYEGDEDSLEEIPKPLQQHQYQHQQQKEEAEAASLSKGGGEVSQLEGSEEDEADDEDEEYEDGDEDEEDEEGDTGSYEDEEGEDEEANGEAASYITGGSSQLTDADFSAAHQHHYSNQRS